MNLYQLFLGQIPEAIYFSLFIILTKSIKEKRILFMVLMIIEYILLLSVFPYSVWSHVGFFVITYVILKLLYKEKAQVTDVFTLGIASVAMILVSFPSFMLFGYTNMLPGTILSKGLLFTLLFVLRNKLCYIQKLYKRLWNKNNTPKRIKSTTFRSINVFIFNIMFYVINIGMVYALLIK